VRHAVKLSRPITHAAFKSFRYCSEGWYTLHVAWPCVYSRSMQPASVIGPMSEFLSAYTTHVRSTLLLPQSIKRFCWMQSLMEDQSWFQSELTHRVNGPRAMSCRIGLDKQINRHSLVVRSLRENVTCRLSATERTAFLHADAWETQENKKNKKNLSSLSGSQLAFLPKDRRRTDWRALSQNTAKGEES